MKPTWVLSDDEKNQRKKRKKVKAAHQMQETTQPIFEQQSKYSVKLVRAYHLIRSHWMNLGQGAFLLSYHAVRILL